VIDWRGASFLILAVVLAGGFVWYERSRPPARIVALVAALAALAVAGRLAFAAIPNVQATTDIVLITGYAVGAAPGFAVGALGALVSNLWLGQGPWTPWEMGAWALVGVGGAGLAALTGRRLGRLPLALACGLAGLLYGAILDYSVLVTAGGPQTLDRYLAISARGLPFNAAHAAGNLILAFAAGPALVRLIGRYRARLEFTWRREWAAPLLLVVALLGACLAAAPRAEASSRSPAAWLARAENADGGFGVAPGSPSSPEMTGWAMLGLEAAGRNPLDVGGGSNAVTYLRAHAGALGSTGDLERTILSLAGAGVRARSLAGRDLVAALRARRRASGSWGGEVNLTAFGIMALRAGGEPASSLGASRRWLERARNRDGGWGFQAHVPSDPDSTGAALQGLAAVGGAHGEVRHGVAYLRGDQNRDGGWPLGGSGPSNSQSTAWAIQGLIAAGASPRTAKAHRSGLDYLAARRAPDGHYRYSATTDQTPVWVTGQALMAVAGKALPLAAVPRQPRRSFHQGTPAGGRAGGGGPTRAGGSASTGPGPTTRSSTSAASGAGAAGGAGAAAASTGPKQKAAPAKASGRRRAPAAPGSRPRLRAIGAGERRRLAGAGAAGETAPAARGGHSGVPTYAYAAAAAVLVAALAAAAWWRRRRTGTWPRPPRLPRLPLRSRGLHRP
jgi:Squalene-hopene cyclase C-terminal domain